MGGSDLEFRSKFQNFLDFGTEICQDPAQNSLQIAVLSPYFLIRRDFQVGGIHLTSEANTLRLGAVGAYNSDALAANSQVLN